MSEIFTFTVEADDGAKMFVNDLMVLDGLKIGCSSIDGTIALMKDTMYSVVLEYQDLTGDGSVRLSWRSRSQPQEVIPPRALFASSTSFFLSNSNNTLFVNPARLCATTSTAFGPELSILTAGVQASFSIQGRDEYGNHRHGPESGVMPREWSLAEPVVKGLLLPFSATVMNLTGNFSTTNSTTNVTTYVPSVVTSGRVSVREGDYVGMWIHLHNLREDREIIAHSQYGSISVSPPFSQLPPMQEPYVIYDIDGLPGGQRRDFDLGTP
eukprot:273641-Rhodomonas_salina.1